MVVVAVAMMRDGLVLMQQRSHSAVHGGLWEFPGGKLESGETPEVAAVRELEEELGVRVCAETLVPVAFASGLTASFADNPARPPRALVILLYACTEWQGQAHAHEAAAIDWCAPGDVVRLDMPPLDYPLAEALCRHLGR